MAGWPMRRRSTIAVLPLLATLAGCGGSMTDQFGSSALIGPDKFDYYRCEQLLRFDRDTLTRKKELEELMNRAAQGGAAGNLIGQAAYRSDYQVAVADRELLARKLAEKRCVLDSTRSSERSMF